MFLHLEQCSLRRFPYSPIVPHRSGAGNLRYHDVMALEIGSWPDSCHPFQRCFSFLANRFGLTFRFDLPLDCYRSIRAL